MTQEINYYSFLLAFLIMLGIDGRGHKRMFAQSVEEIGKPSDDRWRIKKTKVEPKIHWYSNVKFGVNQLSSSNSGLSIYLSDDNREGFPLRTPENDLSNWQSVYFGGVDFGLLTNNGWFAGLEGAYFDNIDGFIGAYFGAHVGHELLVLGKKHAIAPKLTALYGFNEIEIGKFQETSSEPVDLPYIISGVKLYDRLAAKYLENNILIQPSVRYLYYLGKFVALYGEVGYTIKLSSLNPRLRLEGNTKESGSPTIETIAKDIDDDQVLLLERGISIDEANFNLSGLYLSIGVHFNTE